MIDNSPRSDAALVGRIDRSKPRAVSAALIRSIATTKSEAAWIVRAIEESEKLHQMMKDTRVGGILPM